MSMHRGLTGAKKKKRGLGNCSRFQERAARPGQPQDEHSGGERGGMLIPTGEELPDQPGGVYASKKESVQEAPPAGKRVHLIIGGKNGTSKETRALSPA